LTADHNIILCQIQYHPQLQAVLSIIFIPMIFAPVKWYYVAVAYLITPLFALPNSYGCGLTDWDCSSMYAKLALFIFAAWAGVEVRHLAECRGSE
jgi:hypothetical protein